MRPWKPALLIGAVIGAWSSLALAGPNENAKIVVHLVSPTTKNACGRAQAQPSCGAIVSQGSLFPSSYFAYVLAVDGDATAGISGVQFGINYIGAPGIGIDVESWTKCATLEFQMDGWPAPGTGTLLTWDAVNRCQRIEPGGPGTGVVAVAGYFYCAAYTADTLTIIPRPVDLAAKVASCDAVEDTLDSPTLHRVPSPLGFASFSMGALVPGYNPCTEQSEQSASNPWEAQSDGYRLDTKKLTTLLENCPAEFGALSSVPRLLDLPLPSGGFVRVQVLSSPILNQRGSSFKSYIVKGYEGTTGRFDFSSAGLHALLFHSQGIVHIAPSGGPLQPDVYTSSDETESGSGALNCAAQQDSTYLQALTESVLSTGGTLRTFRLAVNGTGEYTQRFASVAAAELQIASTVNLLSALYERELAIRFTLVRAVAYPDPATDPFTTADLVMHNQQILDTELGSANYDLGHAFAYDPVSTGGAGEAVQPAVCRNDSKGKAYSAITDVTSAYFALGVIAHEVGHQFGASHNCSGFGCTFGCGSSCPNGSGPPSAPPAGPEPGGGSTIMCEVTCPQSSCTLQPTSDPYFHVRSLDEIGNYAASIAPTCANQTVSGNEPPIVTADYSTVTIPRSTPFRLNAAASDPDPDLLTFCWEQNDVDASASLGTPFRSRPPVESTFRYFPMFQDILNNVSSPWEDLPDIDRDMTFRISVRDNHPGCGGLTTSQTIIHVVGSPFALTSPNGGEVFPSASTILVAWTPGGGLAASPTIDIVLMNSGVEVATLASAVPNDGLQSVVLPNANYSQSRLMLRASTSVFFDISNTDFVISDATSGVAPSLSEPPQLIIEPNPMVTHCTLTLVGHDESSESGRRCADIEIFDVSGRIVRTLDPCGSVDGTVVWNGRNSRGRPVSPGLYYAVARLGGNKRVVQKVIVFR